MGLSFRPSRGAFVRAEMPAREGEIRMSICVTARIPRLYFFPLEWSIER